MARESSERRDYLAIVVGVCAIVGPPLSYIMATATASARTEQRLVTLEQNDMSTRQLLTQVREDVAFIRGRIERLERMP